MQQGQVVAYDAEIVDARLGLELTPRIHHLRTFEALRPQERRRLSEGIAIPAEEDVMANARRTCSGPPHSGLAGRWRGGRPEAPLGGRHDDRRKSARGYDRKCGSHVSSASRETGARRRSIRVARHDLLGQDRLQLSIPRRAIVLRQQRSGFRIAHDLLTLCIPRDDAAHAHGDVDQMTGRDRIMAALEV